jgi:hypothetical protein
MCTRMHARTHTCVHACVHTRTHTHTNTHTHIHTHTNERPHRKHDNLIELLLFRRESAIRMQWWEMSSIYQLSYSLKNAPIGYMCPLPFHIALIPEFLTIWLTVGSSSTSVSVPYFWLSWLSHFVHPPLHVGASVPISVDEVSNTVVGGVLVDGTAVVEVQGWPRQIFFWWEHILQ